MIWEEYFYRALRISRAMTPAAQRKYLEVAHRRYETETASSSRAFIEDGDHDLHAD